MVRKVVFGASLDFVTAVVAPGASSDNGYDATSIAAFFGAPPPGTASPGQVTFKRYGVTKAIPTFVPFPASPPTSRSVGVAVEYANVVGPLLGDLARGRDQVLASPRETS
jgi:hypothetical protein